MSSKFSCPASFQGGTPTAFVTVHVIVFNDEGVPAPIAGAAVTLNGPTGASYGGTTDGTGAVKLLNVAAPALFVTLGVTASGFQAYSNTLTIETLPNDITYVVGPPGTATGAQIQLPALVVNGGGSGLCNTTYSNSQPSGIPARPNLRWMRGNFSGHVVPGAGFVPGGSSSPVDQVLTYFLDRYTPDKQALILANYKAQGWTHYQLSWPDSRSVGQSVAQFVATCQQVQAAGLYTVVFLLSKVYDPANMNGSDVGPIVDPVMAALNAVGAADIYCVGWELNLFNDPGTAGGPLAPFQDLINHIAGNVGGKPLYVHFSPGVSAWQPNGSFTNAFWIANVGKLTGLLWQQDRNATPDCPSMQARIADTQVRFGGGFGFPTDSGFGHPFDMVVFEQGANELFYGNLTEAQANQLGLQAIQSPIPNPGVAVMGYMNGCTGNP